MIVYKIVQNRGEYIGPQSERAFMGIEREKALEHSDFCLEPSVFMTECQSSIEIVFLVCEGFDGFFAEAVCVSDCEVSRKNPTLSANAR